MLTDSPFTVYLDELASAQPCPGGGGAAALSGAIGAALVSMVCNLTLIAPGYASVHAEARQVLDRCEALRAELVRLAEQDSQITGWLIPLIHEMRQASEPARASLHLRVQEGLQAAAQTPLAVLEGCVEVMGLGERIVGIGNPVALSDGGAAVAAAEAGATAAALTVEINLAMIEDEAFVQTARARVAACTEGLRARCERTYADVRARL